MVRMFMAMVALLLGGVRAWAAPQEVVFASYNLENYVGESTDESAGPHPKPKSESAIAALVTIIKELNPDVLGLCEMGPPEQFASFQQRLEAAGLGYVASEYVEGPDPDRHLALLSRLPIVERHSVPDVAYELAGVPQKVRRGFLDVTVQLTADYPLRLVGAHLKSKLPAPGGEALTRRYEAQLLRRHAEQILTADPKTNLLVYGDMNELKNEPAVQEIMGPRGSSLRLSDLGLTDEAGDRWTHYWKVADLYSRFDYIFVSPALAHEIVAARSGIYRSRHWNEASDHRPIFTAIVPANRR